MSNSDYKIAIVGPKKVVSGFKSLGVDAFNAEDAENAVAVIRELRAKGKDDLPARLPERERSQTGDAQAGSTETPYAVVIVTENLVSNMSEDDYARITKGALPALVVLPGLEGSTGQSKKKLKELTERAVGSDILS